MCCSVLKCLFLRDDRYIRLIFFMALCFGLVLPGATAWANSPLGLVAGFRVIKEGLTAELNALSPGYVRATLRSPKEEELFNAFMAANSSRLSIITVAGFRSADRLYGELLKAMAKKWGHRIAYWQLGNEVDLPGHWDYGEDPFQDYAVTLRDFDKILKEAGGNPKISIGFSSQVMNKGRYKEVLAAIQKECPGVVDAIDLHYHQERRLGPMINRHIRSFKKELGPFPGFNNLAITVSENSTWVGKPAFTAKKVKQFPEQTELDQAVYCAETTYSALAEGVEMISCGVVMDRVSIRSNEEPHPFTLNGLYFNPKRSYAFKYAGPAKMSAYTFRIESWLLDGVKSIKEAPLDNSRNIRRFKVDGLRPHTVLWYESDSENIGNGQQKVVFKNDYGEPLVVVPLVSATKGSWPIADVKRYVGISPAETNDKGEVIVTIKDNLPIALIPKSKVTE